MPVDLGDGADLLVRGRQLVEQDGALEDVADAQVLEGLERVGEGVDAEEEGELVVVPGELVALEFHVLQLALHVHQRDQVARRALEADVGADLDAAVGAQRVFVDVENAARDAREALDDNELLGVDLDRAALTQLQDLLAAALLVPNIVVVGDDLGALGGGGRGDASVTRTLRAWERLARRSHLRARRVGTSLMTFASWCERKPSIEYCGSPLPTRTSRSSFSISCITFRWLLFSVISLLSAV